MNKTYALAEENQATASVNPLIAAALDYASRGWRVIPVGPDKKPRDPDSGKPMSDWPNRAATDSDTIAGWCAAMPAGWGIGIATGRKSGLVVIDVDMKSGRNGLDSIHKLEEEFGPLPPTLTARTPSGGLHFFFRYPNGITCLVPNKTSLGRNVLGSNTGIDVRGDGGQVVAAPTVRDGITYKWESESDLAELPDLWLQFIVDGHTDSPAIKTTRGQDQIAEGSRNDTLFREGCALRGKGLGEPEIAAILHASNRTRCKPPIPDREVDQIAASVMRYDENQRLECNDSGNAGLFAEMFHHQLRYQSDSKKWVIWNGTCWAPDSTGEIFRLAREIPAQLKTRAKVIADEKVREAVLKWAKRSGDRARLKAMLDLAATDARIASLSTAFDVLPGLLPVLNGVIDLTTGDVLAHDRSRLVTKVVPFDYKPDARGPRFIKFLQRVLPDAAMSGFVQRLLGYSLLGSPRERTFIVFQGRGANGKSTLLDTVSEVVKPFVTKTPATTFLARDSESTVRSDHAILQASRLVVGGETPDRRKLDSATIKSITGDREFTARPLYHEEVTFPVTFQVVMVTNPLPNVDEADTAVWDRLILVPFDVRIPKAERDKDLVDKLVREEGEAVLAWLVRGAIAYSKLGLGVPEACEKRTSAWRRKVGSIQRFAEEECDAIRGYELPLVELHDRYRFWTQCRHMNPYGIESFRQRLSELGVAVVDTDDGEVVVGLKPGKVRKPSLASAGVRASA